MRNSRKQQVVARSAFVALAVALVVGVTAAQAGDSGRWSRSHGPEGGWLSAIAVAPTNSSIVYAAAPDGGVFKSPDGGESWRSVTPRLAGPVRGALVVDPRAASTVYVGTGRGVFKSTDGGRSWRLRTAGMFDARTSPDLDWRLGEGFVTALSINPRRSSTVYAGSYFGLFKTSDGGRTWRPANRGLNVTREIRGQRRTFRRIIQALAIDPQEPRTLYIGTSSCCIYESGGVFKSTNGGRSWHRIGLRDRSVNAIAVESHGRDILYAGTRDGVYRSVDGGKSWRATGPERRAVHQLVFDDGPNATLFASTDRGLFRTTDRGRDWERMRVAFASGNATIAVTPGDPASLYAGTGLGLFKTANGGRTWRSSNSGLVATSVQAISIAARQPGAAYVVTAGGGLFKTTDAGARWQPVGMGLRAAIVTTAVTHPRKAGTVFATTSHGLLKSLDGGARWSVVLRGRVGPVAIDPRESETIFAASARRGLVKSIDGGATWQSVSPGWIGSAIAIDPTRDATLYASRRTNTFRSTDGGSTWERVLGTGYAVLALAIEPVHGDVYAATFGRVWRSSDGGGSWQAVSVGSRAEWIRAIASDPTRPETVYAAGHGVFRSTDRGMTWERFGSGAGAFEVAALAVSSDGRKIYAGTVGGGVADLELSR
jgi:photosystem II stability/assembly factor-like uncharacterized protein